MKIRLTVLVWSIIWLVVNGCAGKGEVIAVDIPIKQVSAGALSPRAAGLRVAVEPFDDSRPQKARLGVRSHLWGGESYFEVPDGSSSEAARQALVQFLNSKGWNAHMVRPGQSLQAADLTISGHVLALSVDAKSLVGSTKLMTASKMVIRAVNHADDSVVRMTLNGAGSDSVFWFEPEDAQLLVNEILNDSFNRLLQNTRVEGKVLRLREQAG
ncbi:MAG: hypothetical protein HY038_03495 [Nitrospirae bacterium]|nr:hypothetical protein [Nitrospirota bacterium]